MRPRSLCLAGMFMFGAAIPAIGQFSQLVATDDGKQIYFTSQLSLKGSSATNSTPDARLYRYGPDGVTLYAERGPLSPANNPGAGGTVGFSSSDGISGPQVSADGGIVGFTFVNICESTTTCARPISAEGELLGRNAQDLGPGVLQLSRNGKWALLTVTDYDASSTLTQSSTLIDLTTGQKTAVPSPPQASGLHAVHDVASDGTLLVRQDKTVGIWKQGQFTPIQFPIGLAFSPIAVSDDGGSIFLSGAVPGPGGPVALRILKMDLGSGKLTTIFQQSDSTQLPIFMGASSNGQIVLYRYISPSTANGPAFVFNAATGASTPISLPSGELAYDGTITGGGDFVFIATSGGRIVKVTLATGAVDTLFPATPHCDDVTMVPGSFVRLHCNVTGSVSDLQGQILVNGIALPILYVNTGEIGAQVPWKSARFLLNSLTLTTPSSSPFQAAQPVSMPSMAPQFEPADPGTSPLLGFKLVKGDWSGLLTSQPAPGDVFYAYMTGLGAVNGPMQDGVPAPLSPPAPITTPLTCTFAANSSPAKTLFAGLAPATVGIYQVAFQLPADAGSQPVSCVSCTWRGGVFSMFCGGLTQTPASQSRSAIMKLLPDDRRGQ